MTDTGFFLFYVVSMTYIFKLSLKPASSTLALVRDGAVVAEASWPEERNMGQKLFATLRQLLTENGLKPEQVSDFVLESEIPDVYTSMRIAETVKKVYAFGVSVQTNKQG